eukprot:1103477-Pelagomonas_calceolata.AAC.5
MDPTAKFAPTMLLPSKGSNTTWSSSRQAQQQRSAESGHPTMLLLSNGSNITRADETSKAAAFS